MLGYPLYGLEAVKPLNNIPTPEWNPEMESLLQLGLNAGGNARNAMLPYMLAKQKYQPPASPTSMVPVPMVGQMQRGLLDPRSQTPEYLGQLANNQDQYRAKEAGKVKAEHATKSANVKAPRYKHSTGEKVAFLLWTIAMLGGADPRFGMGVFQNWQQGRQQQDDEFVAGEKQKLDAEYQGKLDALGAGAIGTQGIREKARNLEQKNTQKDRKSLAMIQMDLERGMKMNDRDWEADQAARAAGEKAKTDGEKLADDRYEKLRDDYTNLAEAYGGMIPKNEVLRLNQDVKRLIEGSGRTYSYFESSGTPTMAKQDRDADNARADRQTNLDERKFESEQRKVAADFGIENGKLALEIAKYQAGAGGAPDAKSIATAIRNKRAAQANLKAQAKAIEGQINAFGKNLHQLPDDKRSIVIDLRKQQRAKLAEAAGLEGEVKRLAAIRQSSAPQKPQAGTVRPLQGIQFQPVPPNWTP